jgi:hypothetical protein
MATRLVHLAQDARDPGRLARFWSAALGWPILAEDPAQVDIEPDGYSYPDPAAVPLDFVRVPEAKAGPNRVHLDLASSSAAHQRELIERLIGLGAARADIGQGDVPWQVLADPEGNELCVLEPREVYRDTGPVAAVVIACQDPQALAGFWSAAAGWDEVRSEPGLAVLRSPAGTGPFLELLRSPEAARAGKSRLHPDVAPYPGDDQAADVRRLLGAGAELADIGQGDVSWTVLTDPAGTHFCVLTPR